MQGIVGPFGARNAPRLVGFLLLCVPLAVAGDGVQRQAAKPVIPPRIEDFAPPDEFVMVGPVKTHFVTEGTKGRPIVLVHGFGETTYTWHKNIAKLAADYRVYALDLRGFGLSAKPKDGQYHLETYTKHLLGFLDVMKLDKPILVGNSMGGAVCARLALLHPERVSALVVEDAIPPTFSRPSVPSAMLTGNDGSNARPSTSKTWLGLSRFLMTRPMVASSLRSCFHNPELVTEEMIEANYRATTIDGAAEAFVAMMGPAPNTEQTLPPLSTLKVPALVLWGRHDRLVPLALSDVYTKAIRDVRFHVFDDAGHLPHAEVAEAFNSKVREFANQLP